MIHEIARQHDFGNLVASFRKRKGISARALSTAIGVSPSYIGKMERAEFVPKVDVFVRLVTVLELNDTETIFLLHSATKTD